MAKVIELTFTRAAEKRPYPESVSLKIEINEDDNIQQVIRRARTTALIAFGERPTGIAATMQRERMLRSAQNLVDQAEELVQGGF